jgi:hypothetical protein
LYGHCDRSVNFYLSKEEKSYDVLRINLERISSVAMNPVFFLFCAHETSESVGPNPPATRTNVNTKIELIRISAAQAVMSQMRVAIPRSSASLGKVLTCIIPYAVPMPPPDGDG